MMKCGVDGYQKVLLGDTATFDISFSNQSDFKITNVVVTDKLPPGFIFQTATPGAPTLIQQPDVGEIDGTVTWVLQELPARKPVTFQIQAKAAFAGTFRNTVRLTTPHSTKYFDATCTIDVVAPELKVWKFCPPIVAVNQPFPYSYVVKNPGTEQVNNIVVRDQLPLGVIAESGEKEPTWTFDRLAPGNTIEESFNVIPQDSLLPGGAAYGGFCRVNGRWLQGHSVTNTITASAPWAADRQRALLSQEQCNTCVRPAPYPALLLEVVDLYDTIKVGDTTTYKITVTNQDHADVKNINVAVWIPEAYYAPGDDTSSLAATLDDLIKPMASSQPKVRLLKSAFEPSPGKQPLIAQPLRTFPETMRSQMLEEMLRSMMWTVLRTELARLQRVPEDFRQDVLHHHLERHIKELKREFLQSGSPLHKDAGERLLGLHRLLRQKVMTVLRDMIRTHSQLHMAHGHPTELAEKEQNILKTILPKAEDLPPYVRPDQLQTKLQKTMEKMWPGDEPEMRDDRWITFPTVPHLKQHWRATYYVQVQAVEPEDVRFKVIMSADAFRGPVIETESTHLID